MGKPTIPGQEKQGAMNFIEYESRRLGKIYRRAEINGIKFEIGFDNMSYQKYTCYFPEIHSRAKKEENGLSEPELLIGEKDSDAEKTYNYICQAGLETDDVDELYEKTEKFLQENVWNQDE